MVFLVSFHYDATVRTIKPSVSAPDLLVAEALERSVERLEPALLHVRE